MIGEFRQAEPVTYGAAANSDSVLLTPNSGPAPLASTGPGHVTALV